MRAADACLGRGHAAMPWPRRMASGALVFFESCRLVAPPGWRLRVGAFVATSSARGVHNCGGCAVADAMRSQNEDLRFVAGQPAELLIGVVNSLDRYINVTYVEASLRNVLDDSEFAQNVRWLFCLRLVAAHCSHSRSSRATRTLSTCPARARRWPLISSSSPTACLTRWRTRLSCRCTTWTARPTIRRWCSTAPSLSRSPRR